MVLATMQLPDGIMLDYTAEQDWVASPAQPGEDAASTAQLLNILFDDWVGYGPHLGDPVHWQVHRVADFTHATILYLREAEAEVLPNAVQDREP